MLTKNKEDIHPDFKLIRNPRDEGGVVLAPGKTQVSVTEPSVQAPHIYGQLVSNEGVSTVQQGRNGLPASTPLDVHV